MASTMNPTAPLRTSSATLEPQPWASVLFSQPLLNLGPRENPEFAGVFSPCDEIGAERLGVNAVFLENAEEYYKRYQGFEYWRNQLSRVLNHLKIAEPSIIVEYGCGFGNATLPMLDIFPKAKVLASDISPNLLAILHRLLEARGLSERCVPVAMDALKPYVREGTADLVFGAAILHHLTRPEDFVSSAMHVLKLGNFAFFFEPLEGGHAILLQMIEEILREAKRRSEWNHPLYCIAMLADSFRPQIFRGGPGWAERDDKWAFSRSKLDDMAEAADADATVLPLHDNVGQFRRHLTYMLETYVSVPRADVPDWVWVIVDRYDQATFSPEMLRDLALEGCVIFRKHR